jgi:hypothetical protein
MDNPKNRGGPAADPDIEGRTTVGSMMTGSDIAETAELWRRWRYLAPEGSAEPDFMDLARFAEGRTDPEGETVDEWLAARPDLLPERLDDLMAARAAATAGPEAVSDLMIARAMALVTAPGDGVVPFRRPAPRRLSGWRGAAAWGGLAASLVATSLVGFALGTNAWTSLSGEQQASSYQELFDPPAGIFTGISEDEGI